MLVPSAPQNDPLSRAPSCSAESRSGRCRGLTLTSTSRSATAAPTGAVGRQVAVGSVVSHRASAAKARSTSTATPLAAGAPVVGESFYKPALERRAALAVPVHPPLPVKGPSVADDVVEREPDLPWFQALLVRGPDNEYNSNAMAAAGRLWEDRPLSRDDAKRYQDVLIAVEDGAQAGVCSAFMRRADNGNWGVVLVLVAGYLP